MKDKAGKARLSTFDSIKLVVPPLIFGSSFFIASSLFGNEVHNTRLTGLPFFSFFGIKLYNPIYYFMGMLTNISNPKYTQAYLDSAKWIPISAAAALLFCFLWSIITGSAFHSKNLHGTAAFAGIKDLEENGLLKDAGISFGMVSEHSRVSANKKKDGSVSLKLIKAGQLLCHPGKLNTLLLAPTGSGKGVGVIIPTLLTWGIHEKVKYVFKIKNFLPHLVKIIKRFCDKSIICFDPKGENYNITAGFRAKYSRVLKFAPCSTDTLRFNPVMAIRDGDEYAYRDASSIASIIFAPAKAGQSDPNEYFINMAKDLLTAALLHVRFSNKFPDSEKNLAGVLHWLTKIDTAALEKKGSGQDGNDEVGKEQCLAMIKEPHYYTITEKMYRNNPRKYKEMIINGRKGYEYIIRDEQRRIVKNNLIGLQIPAEDVDAKCRFGGQASLKQNPKERASCNSEINSKLSLFNDPLIANATSGSDFEIEDFMNPDKPISLYLVVPYSDISRIAPVFRILLQFMLTKFSEGETQFGEEKLKYPILFLLDEFPVLGTFPSLAENMGVLRGYGCFFMIVCQALNQLVDRYGQNHPFLDHCPVHIVYAPGSTQDAKSYSDAIGQESVSQGKVSYGEKRGFFASSNRNYSDNEFGRALMDPADIKRLDPAKSLIMVHGMQPYIANKIVYYMDKRFTSRYMSNGKILKAPDIRELYRECAALPSNLLKKERRKKEEEEYRKQMYLDAQALKLTEEEKKEEEEEINNNLFGAVELEDSFNAVSSKYYKDTGAD